MGLLLAVMVHSAGIQDRVGLGFADQAVHACLANKSIETIE